MNIHSPEHCLVCDGRLLLRANTHRTWAGLLAPHSFDAPWAAVRDMMPCLFFNDLILRDGHPPIHSSVTIFSRS